MLNLPRQLRHLSMNKSTQGEDRPEMLRIDRQILPNGTHVVRRYEHGLLVTESHEETLVSGKRILRQFDGSNRLQLEMHSYGMLDISMHCKFVNGNKTAEAYLVKNRLVSRRSYERARLKYSDMPVPDVSFRDTGGELQRMMAAERTAAAGARKTHVADPERASQIDKFCRERISAGRCADAQIWLRAPNHTLGEMNEAESRRLLKRLARLGAVRIFACEIEDYGERGQNTGHLVVELPKEEPSRSKLFGAIARIAESQGFDGDPDDSQDYAYLKLD